MNVFRHCATAALLAMACSYPGHTQAIATNGPLPDAPGTMLQTATPNRPTPDAEDTARIQGVVASVQGDVIPDAKVTLEAPGKLDERTAVSGTAFNASSRGSRRPARSSP